MPEDDGTTLKCEGSNPRLPNSALEDSIVLTVMCKFCIFFYRFSTIFSVWRPDLACNGFLWHLFDAPSWRSCSYLAHSAYCLWWPYNNIKIKVSCFVRHMNFVDSSSSLRSKEMNKKHDIRKQVHDTHAAFATKYKILFCIKITYVSHRVVHTYTRDIKRKMFVVHLDDSKIEHIHTHRKEKKRNGYSFVGAFKCWKFIAKSKRKKGNKKKNHQRAHKFATKE